MLYKQNFSLMLALALFIYSGSIFADHADFIRYRAIIYLKNTDITNAQINKLTHDSLFTRVYKIPYKLDKPVLKLAVVEDFQKHFPLPGEEFLRQYNRGVTNQDIIGIKSGRKIVVMDFAYSSQFAMKGLISSNQLIGHMADKLGGLVWDSETGELFTPEAWRQIRMKAWEGETPLVSSHTLVRINQDDDSMRAVTFGMAKFGLPDLVVEDFSRQARESMNFFMNIVSQLLVEGARPNKEGNLTVSIEALRRTKFKTEMLKNTTANAQAVKLNVSIARWQDGDPYNYGIRLSFVSKGEISTQQILQKQLSRFFGRDSLFFEEKQTGKNGTSEVRLTSLLPKLRSEFNRGLAPGEMILLKVPIKSTSGQLECVWLQVTAWDHGKITGLLKNKPTRISGINSGARVTVNQTEVLDYIRRSVDGSRTDSQKNNR